MNKKNERSDKIFTIVITVIVILLIAYNIFSYYGAHITLPGSEIKQITGTDPKNGDPVTIDVSSGVVILNLWATWCEACVKEMPELNAISAKYNTVGVLRGPVEELTYERLAPSFRNAAADDAFFDKYMISVLPTTILLKDGTVKKVHTGMISQNAVESWIRSIDE